MPYFIYLKWPVFRCPFLALLGCPLIIQVQFWGIEGFMGARNDTTELVSGFMPEMVTLFCKIEPETNAKLTLSAPLTQINFDVNIV
jgi:hypothetical protein